MNHFSTIPGGAGGGSGSGSASASTHASMEGTASAASHAERPSSAAASSLPVNQTSDSYRHGLGLFNGDSHSSPASQSSASLYHQHQSGRPAPLSHQNQHPPQQSYNQNQQQQQQQSQQHHRQQTASISSTFNFRYESTDSGLTPSFSSNTIVYSSPSFINDPSETASQSVHASTPVSANASSQVLIASIVQRLVNKVCSAAVFRREVPFH